MMQSSGCSEIVHKLPTGYLIVDNYSRGQLETLSIGDYGKRYNVKADFLGYREPINGVTVADIAPLSEKWVITLSTQYGCPMKCTFCDVPKIKFGGNATVDDMKQQVRKALSMFPDVTYTERLNVHFVRMGEPSFNHENVLNTMRWLGTEFRKTMRVEVVHPVYTTSMPDVLGIRKMKSRLRDMCRLKNGLYMGQAGLQISINSTNDAQRYRMFRGAAMSLSEIAAVCEGLPEPIGRKYCLNFAYASNTEIDGTRLSSMFDTDKFMCKITPIHNNNAGIETIDGYSTYTPYEKPEQSLKDAGFDVLVFIPSLDEERGLITCGNAVIAGSTPCVA